MAKPETTTYEQAQVFIRELEDKWPISEMDGKRILLVLGGWSGGLAHLKKNVIFMPKFILKDKDYMRYMLIHEYAHFRHQKHSKLSLKEWLYLGHGPVFKSYESEMAEEYGIGIKYWVRYPRAVLRPDGSVIDRETLLSPLIAVSDAFAVNMLVFVIVTEVINSPLPFDPLSFATIPFLGYVIVNQSSNVHQWWAHKKLGGKMYG